MSPDGSDSAVPRPRGRPKAPIDLDAVADAVAELFAQGGLEAVTIPAAADKLDVSRATLYRAIPTKEELLGILFERSTRELTVDARAVVASSRDVRDRLYDLIGLQVAAAVHMRLYMPVFFGGGWLPSDVVERWRTWSREYELLWSDCVGEAMDAGVLDRENVVATTRLILGMCIWVSRWYRPNEGIGIAEITESAINLLAFDSEEPAW